MSWLKKHYKYTLHSDYYYQNDKLKGVSFKNKWVEIRPSGEMIISKFYSWDGCSPKYKIFGIVIGTPDGKNNQCKMASCVHDIFCQFIADIPVSKKTVLGIFGDMLRDANWGWAKAYVYAVDKFGPQNFKL